ncbi:cytoplasmic dynein intermediate chain 1 [Aphelenchoides avenae]|nr:cytoplasmic dynein intermediate chain 1 [Aphelenchus avenae]
MHPELMATAYSDDQSDVLAPAGVVHLWNTRFKNRTPEHTFHSNSRVMSMLFARYHSNLVIGGLYSGRICMWDNRVNKKTPVCQSPLSSNAHTQPVLAMKVVGTKNAHDLVTVSTDGRLCSWSIDSIHAPIEVVDLNAKDHRQVPAVSMSFFANNINSFAVGCEDGFLFVGDRHGTKGEMSRSIRAHSAPVRSVDMHRAAGHVDFSPLCVSGSLDFSVKLWNLKDSELLLSLERKHRHYVTDVQWSPVHPAVFISTDIDGMLNLWNLNVDTETPVSSIQVENGITRALWSHNGAFRFPLPPNANHTYLGQQLVAADHKGKVSLFDVHESLWNVRPNEWEQLAETLKDVKLASTTEEASPQPPQSALATIDAGRPSLPAGFSFDGRQSIGFDGRASIGFDGRASLQPGSLQYA